LLLPTKRVNIVPGLGECKKKKQEKEGKRSYYGIL